MSEINFRVTTPSLNVSSPVRYSPDYGIMNSAIIHFPSGCQQLVEVLIYHKNDQILPTPSTGGTGGHGIALEDITQSFAINEPVKRGDPIMVKILNHDEDNPHTLSIVILIAETEKYTGP